MASNDISNTTSPHLDLSPRTTAHETLRSGTRRKRAHSCDIGEFKQSLRDLHFPRSRNRVAFDDLDVNRLITGRAVSDLPQWDTTALLHPAQPALTLAHGSLVVAHGRQQQPGATIPQRRPSPACQPDDVPRSSHGDSASPATPAGLCNMVLGLNNVQAQATAAAHPVKRRRVEPSNGLGDTETQPVSIQERSAIPQQNGSTSHLVQSNNDGALIDLTNDDETPTCHKDPEEEEVCLGMITVRLACTIVPSPKPNQKSLYDGRWPPIKVVLRRRVGDHTTTISAYDHTRSMLGRLDDPTAGCLAPLLDAPSLRLRTDCRIPSRPKRPGETPGVPIEQHEYPLEVIMYSCLRHARTIGRHLSVHDIRLAVPPVIPPQTRVFNPQAPGFGPTSTSRTLHGISGMNMAVSSSVTSPSSRTLDEVRAEVMGVFDSLNKNVELPEQEPAKTVLTALLKHQKQGLYFLLTREKGHEFQLGNRYISSFWRKQVSLAGQTSWFNLVTSQHERQLPLPTRGGILADMMGLGKTLSILSLIMTTYDEAAEWASQSPMQPPVLPASRHSRSTHPGAPPPLGLTTVVRNAKTTLLVCPLSTVTNWEEQIRQHLEQGKLRYHIYHGPNRIKDPRKLADFDLVITTYGSVSSELGCRSKRKPGLYPLEEIGWFRIVLDEAHMIREHNTLQFKAIYRLQASRRWAVTGTPIQNRLDDFAALLAFLRLKPFDDRNKFLRHIVDPFKSCDPEVVPKLRILVDTITLRRLKDKINLPLRTDEVIRLDFSPEERHIYDLFAKNAKDRVRVLAGSDNERVLGGQSYIHILRSILRLRLLCAHGKDLLNAEDLNTLQGMTADMAITLDDDDDRPSSGLTERQAYDMFRLMQQTNVDTCIACSKKLGSNEVASIESEGQEDIIGHMNPCFHVVCRSCFDESRARCQVAAMDGSAEGPCPACQASQPVSVVALHRSKVDVEHPGSANDRDGTECAKQLGKYSGPHTKTRALVQDLLGLEQKSQAKPEEPPYKSVVFSGWTSHLDLIQLALDNAGIKYTRLDGTMSRTARGQAMNAFRDDHEIHVILVSIMAGGMGLNLTSGNTVFVMEPQYNPAAEAQAVDRIHRLGQKRPVRTVRFIMNNSFEEKMIELQDKKMKLASLSMDGKGRALDKAEAARQKLRDLRSLFK